MPRKFFALALVLAAGVLCGCARHYVITLTNGSQVGATSKPKLKGGYYVFKDAMGRQAYVSSGRVTEIAPASMANKPGSTFIPGPSQ